MLKALLVPVRGPPQPIVDRGPLGTIGRRLDPDFVGLIRVEFTQTRVEPVGVADAVLRCIEPRSFEFGRLRDGVREHRDMRPGPAELGERILQRVAMQQPR